MSEKDKRGLPKWLDKLKNVKHIEIYVAILAVVVLLLIYMSGTKSNDTAEDNKTTSSVSVMNYIDNLECDLEEILSNIGGVENVKVLITLDTEQLNVENSTVILSEFPKIKGVLITAKGAGNTNKKLKILHAIEAVIDVKNSNIQILSSE